MYVSVCVELCNSHKAFSAAANYVNFNAALHLQIDQQKLPLILWQILLTPKLPKWHLSIPGGVCMYTCIEYLATCIFYRKVWIRWTLI